MASYQEIETRLKVVERKLDFLMKIGSATVRVPSVVMPGEFVEVQKSLLDLYHAVNQFGGKLVESAEPVTEETDGRPAEESKS